MLHLTVVLLIGLPSALASGQKSGNCFFNRLIATPLRREATLLSLTLRSIPLAIPLVGRRHVTIEEPETTKPQSAAFPFNVRHPLGDLDPSTRIETLRPNSNVRDKFGTLWKVDAIDANEIHLKNGDPNGSPPTRTIPLQALEAPVHRLTLVVTEPGNPPHRIELLVPADTDGTYSRSNRRLVQKLRGLIAKLPRAAIRDIKQIRINPEPCRNDAIFADQMAHFTGMAAATAGQRTIDIYRTKEGEVEISLDLLRHELGHLICEAAYGKTAPDPEWERAIEADRAFLGDALPFSQYATNSPTEDFAEAVLSYLKADGGARLHDLRRWYPNRFRILDRILRADPQLKIACRELATEYVFRRLLYANGLAIAGVLGQIMLTALAPTPSPTPTTLKSP